MEAGHFAMLRDEVGFNSSREAFERGAQCARPIVVQQPRKSAVREQGPPVWR